MKRMDVADRMLLDAPAWVPDVEPSLISTRRLANLMDARSPDLEVVGYLHRWRVDGFEGPGYAYLHRMLGPDESVLHDHPFRFRSIILEGGYDSVNWREPDNSEVFRRRLRAGDVIDMPAGGEDHEFHYIENILPGTTTLILTTPTMGYWGFMTLPGGRPPEIGKPLSDERKFMHFMDGRGRQQAQLIHRHGYDDEPTPDVRAAHVEVRAASEESTPTP